MKKLLVITTLAVMACSPALAATMASQPWVTNRIAEAEARVDAKIVAATNAIPAPGDYATVSNRAMEAVLNDEFADALGSALDDGGWDMFYDWLPLGLGYIDENSPRYYRINHSVYLTNDVVEIFATSGVGGYFKIEREDGVGVCMTNSAVELWGDLKIARAGMVDSIWDISGLYELHLPQTVRIGQSGPELNLLDVATRQQATNAAVAVADAKISTNNPAFVSAVLSVPLTGADAGDLAEIAEYGGYGTVGAALLALIAGLAALKRRVTSAETALAQKANTADLPYRLVEPGKWEFIGVPFGFTDLSVVYSSEGGEWKLQYEDGGIPGESAQVIGDGSELSIVFADYSETYHITATRASLPGHLLDRAGNRVVVTDSTTLTLPAAVPGYLRDFLVRLEISGSTVPTITFAAPTGETITYETDGDEFPVPDEAGTWIYSFTENCVAHKFAVSLKKVNTVAQGGS